MECACLFSLLNLLIHENKKSMGSLYTKDLAAWEESLQDMDRILILKVT
jgi:hypothetical protein